MLIIEEGIITPPLRPLPLKASAAIVLIFAGSSIFLRAVQPAKALPPISERTEAASKVTEA